MQPEATGCPGLARDPVLAPNQKREAVETRPRLMAGAASLYWASMAPLPRGPDAPDWFTRDPPPVAEIPGPLHRQRSGGGSRLRWYPPHRPAPTGSGPDFGRRPATPRVPGDVC